MLMRALIVLLLVLNAGVAAWWWLAPAPAPAAEPAHPAGVLRLRLVSEARPAAPVASPAPPVASEGVPAAAPAAMPVAAVVATQCVRLGPFPETAAAEAARARLPAGVASVRVRAQGASRGAWTVVMPPQADAAAAQALAQRIEAAGFRDYYVIRGGASANGIALGRFGGAEAARRHQASLQAAGFAAQVQGPAGATYWLDVDAGGGFDAPSAGRAVGATQVLPRACPQAGRAGPVG